VSDGEVDALVAERSWKEFEKALGEQNPQVFIEVLKECGALEKVMPELNTLFGVPQVAKYHPEIDTGVHTLLCLEQASSLSQDKSVRFSVLVHDLGKALTEKKQWPKHHGHETLGLPALAKLCERLKVPNQYKELAKVVMEFHTHCHRAFDLKASTILKLFKKVDAYRKPERFENFVLCCKADALGRTGFELRNYPQANFLLSALKAANKVTPKQFVENGLKGKEIGEAVEEERLKVLKVLVAANKKSLKFYAS
jgi:tRNA nucleotidyltransferase (CCA-adding enzyme)